MNVVTYFLLNSEIQNSDLWFDSVMKSHESFCKISVIITLSCIGAHFTRNEMDNKLMTSMNQSRVRWYRQPIKIEKPLQCSQPFLGDKSVPNSVVHEQGFSSCMRYGYHQRENTGSRLFTEVYGVDIWMGYHLDKMPCTVLHGKSGWRSGHESRLPPLLQILYVNWVSDRKSVV